MEQFDMYTFFGPVRFTGDRAYSIAGRLVAISRSVTLEPRCAAARDELVVAYDELGSAFRCTLGDSNGRVDDAHVGQVDLTRAWRTFHLFLIAWSKITASEAAAEDARVMLRLLFPTKLAFLKTSQTELLARSRRRLDAIGEEMGDRVHGLGGHHFLGEIETHHERLCVALHAKAISSGSAGTPACRRARANLNRAIDRYAESVIGLTAPALEASVARTEMLLAPLGKRRITKRAIAQRKERKMIVAMLSLLRPKLIGERPS